jgi:arylsulfatase A-like enzyme
MWFCPGANHAPHQAPQEYIDKYKGKFDDGYAAYREWVLKRMIEKGVFPEDTKLTPINPLPEEIANPADAVRPWETLNDDEKKLFCRMAEVWAGASEYADAQIERLIDYLEESGQLENTLVFYAADNGTSGEGSPNGSVNENKLFNNWPDDLKQNMTMIDKLGGPDCYNHMPTGWAVAFSTPFKMFKRYSEYSGGTCDPMIVSWPKGIKARGEVRHQYHHSNDIAATILDVCGLEMPETYRGVEQYPMAGVSMRYSFDADPDGPTQKKRQYFEMMGTRGIWEDGWRAASVHAPISGRGHFDQDQWELYHVDEDRSESTDLAEKYPEKLEHLKRLWMDEARKNLVLPLDDRTARELLTLPRPSTEPPRQRYVYYPDTTAVPESVAANVRGRSYKILANVEVGEDCSGVLFAHGSRFGGHSLFIKDQKLNYVYNFLGIPPEQRFVSDETLKPGKYTLGVEFIREKAGQYGESHGTAKLYIDDKVVAEGPMRTQTGKFTLCGDGLCVGRDSADAVAAEYTPETQGAFTGGTIEYVEVSVEKEQYRDLEREMAAALAVD